MEMYDLLLEQMNERFKANSIIESIESKITRMTEETILSCHKNDQVMENDLVFEVLGVKSLLYSYDTMLTPKHMTIQVYFICVSKLPKAKRERVDYAKNLFLKEKYFPDSYYKTRLWFRLNYKVDVKNFLLGKVNLRLGEHAGIK